MLSRIGNKIISIVLLGALFTGLLPAFSPVRAAAAPATEPVALVNAGFEDVNTAGTAPVGWSYWGGGHAVGMSVSDTVYTEGRKSLKLSVTDQQVVGVQSTRFNVTAGDSYTVTSSVYVESINAGVANAYVTMLIKYFDANNAAVTPDKTVNLSPGQFPLGQWFELPVEWVVPAGATQAQVFISVNKATASVTYYDNIRVTHTIPEVQEGTPVNGSFEAALLPDSFIRGWRSDPAVPAAGNSISVSSDYAVSGTNSLKIVDASSASSIGALSAPVPVKPGNLYSVSLQGRVAAGGSGNPFIYVYFHNASGAKLGSGVQPAGQNLNITALDTWQAKTPYTDIVAPEGAASMTILLNLGVGTVRTVYIDDVAVSEKRVLQNGGFEQAASGSEIPGWEPYPGNPMPSDRIIAVTTEKSSGGNASVKLIDNSAGSMGLISKPIDIAGGKTYAVSLKTFIESGSARVYIEYLDAAGSQVEFKSAGLTSPLNRWTDLNYELTAPNHAATARIWLYSGGAVTGTTYYDDVLFQEVSVLALPYEYAKPVSLGDATVVSKTQGAAVGNGEIYFGTNGSPSVFYAVDAVTGEANFQQSLPGEDVVWAVAVGADNNVYVAGTQTGNLYRYNPTLKKLENLGANPSNKWVWDLDASADGKIYGSTYAAGNGKTFVYDIAAGRFQDMGAARPGQDYVRGGGVSGGYFYAGTGTTAYLYRYDRATLEKTEIPLPITGAATSISNVYAYNGKLFVVYGTSLIILDESTYKVLQTIDWQSQNAFDGLLSPPSPYNPNLVYFRNKNTSTLWTYDTAANQFAAVDETMKLPNLSSKAMDWVRIGEGANVRYALLLMTNEINVTLYDPIAHTITSYDPKVATVGIDIQSLESGPDGNLYMGGYQGAMSVYDTRLGRFTVQEKEPHQIEGIGFINGKVYYGIYGGAVIYEYDPAKPFRMGTNPKVIHDIQSGQSRPFTFASGDSKLFVGTVADYGQLGGALTVYDSNAGTWTEHRNIVPNQSVIGLAYLNGKVYGGTSIWGGLGVEPSEAEARLFEWDVAEKKATYVGRPAVPGFSPQMIGELSIGPDGNLWGIMWGTTPASDSAFALFAMNPGTKEIIKSRVMNTGARASTWRPFFLRWGTEDGLLYTTLGRELYVFDPQTLASRKLVSDPVHLMTLGPDGSIYYASGAKLMKLPVRMNGASLTASASRLVIGESLDLNVGLSLVNGKTGSAGGAAVQYTVSDPQVAEIRDGKLYGLRKGVVTVSATVVQDTVQLSTNAVQIQVDWASEFSIAGISFTDWNDNPVAGLKPGEIVQARVTVRNHTDQAKEAVLIVALYDKSGRMVNVSLLSREFAKESEDTIRAGFRLPDSTDGYTVKAMVWDDVSTMNPLAPSVTLSGK
ncbi:carbohydrate binding domain-containing protein [Paenibacillus sp. GCM10012303]|uniref:carbohydrate binding domain-containing protein n=1 Tax=Paenibacillus sp. GCM10012303 TaxID=3317340 RepID=UPI00360B2E36